MASSSSSFLLHPLPPSSPSSTPPQSRSSPARSASYMITFTRGCSVLSARACVCRCPWCCCCVVQRQQGTCWKPSHSRPRQHLQKIHVTLRQCNWFCSLTQLRETPSAMMERPRATVRVRLLLLPILVLGAGAAEFWHCYYFCCCCCCCHCFNCSVVVIVGNCCCCCSCCFLLLLLLFLQVYLFPMLWMTPYCSRCRDQGVGEAVPPAVLCC